MNSTVLGSTLSSAALITGNKQEISNISTSALKETRILLTYKLTVDVSRFLFIDFVNQNEEITL